MTQLKKAGPKAAPKAKTYKDWTVDDIMAKLDLGRTEEEQAKIRKYVETHLDELKHMATSNTLLLNKTSDEIILESIEDAYNDGRIIDWSEHKEPESLPEDDPEPETGDDEEVGDDQEQEIVEVSQSDVKEALKSLMTREDVMLKELYAKHAEFNQQYFHKCLSEPIITIERLSNRVLGDYQPNPDNVGLENHIRMNINFIALNTETRILETLKHEMIHQYQDEVLYEKFDKHDNKIHGGDKRPKKNWHNADFRDWCEMVGIPCIGKNGAGNPANMPEAMTFNRKYQCGCVASNGYPVSIWSTRPIHATCDVCHNPFVEVPKKKGGSVDIISDVEQPGQDAVAVKMSQSFTHFDRFLVKKDLTDKVAELKKSKADYSEGIYQKGHNAYRQGFRYWIAWNDAPAKSASRKAKREGKQNDQGNAASKAE